MANPTYKFGDATYQIEKSGTDIVLTANSLSALTVNNAADIDLVGDLTITQTGTVATVGILSSVSTLGSLLQVGAGNNLNIVNRDADDIIFKTTDTTQMTLLSTGDLNMASGNAYQIANTDVLTNDTLGSGVANASLTSNTGNLTNTGTLNVTTGNDYQINSTSVLNATTLGSAVANASLTSNTGNLTNVGNLTIDTGGSITEFNIMANNSTLGSQLLVGAGNNLVINNMDNNTIQLATNNTTRATIKSTGELNLASGNEYQIANNSVLSATTLGSGVVNASITTNSGDITNTGGLILNSTTEALTVPRMSTTNRGNLTAVDGMIIYNTSTSAFNFRENGAWVTGSGLV